MPSEGRYIQMNTSHSQRLCGQVAVEQRVRTGNDESEVGGFSHFLNRIQFFQLWRGLGIELTMSGQRELSKYLTHKLCLNPAISASVMRALTVEPQPHLSRQGKIEIPHFPISSNHGSQLTYRWLLIPRCSEICEAFFNSFNQVSQIFLDRLEKGTEVWDIHPGDACMIKPAKNA